MGASTAKDAVNLGMPARPSGWAEDPTPGRKSEPEWPNSHAAETPAGNAHHALPEAPGASDPPGPVSPEELP